jgi:glycosyltransferase involved in cell wall biosynthesis
LPGVRTPAAGSLPDEQVTAAAAAAIVGANATRSPMSPRIFYDGLNLGLTHGTGIATYTRLLTRIAHDLGYEVGVVYSTRFTPAAEPALREIAFFDEKRLPDRAPRKLTLLRAINDVLDQIACHRPLKPLPVPMTGAVDTRQFCDSLPVQDRVYVARNLFLNARRFFRRTGRLVELAFEAPLDIFHCTYPVPLRVLGARNLYTIHDLVPLRLPFATMENKRQTWRLLKTIAERADHIVTVSENSKRDIVELLGIPEHRITNTYQAREFPKKDTERPVAMVANHLAGAYGLEWQRYLLFYGALEPKKNVGRLIEAYLAAGVGIPLVLVTGGGWQNEAESKLLAAHSDAGSAIRRLDYVGAGILTGLIRGARAVLFPSLYEGFGLPALEAMALGTPLVAARAAALPEIVGDAALLVDPYDTDAIAAAIRRIASDADLCAELSRRGREQAEKFSVERYRARVAALYAGLR